MAAARSSLQVVVDSADGEMQHPDDACAGCAGGASLGILCLIVCPEQRLDGGRRDAAGVDTPALGRDVVTVNSVHGVSGCLAAAD